MAQKTDMARAENGHAGELSNKAKSLKIATLFNFINELLQFEWLQNHATEIETRIIGRLFYFNMSIFVRVLIHRVWQNLTRQVLITRWRQPLNFIKPIKHYIEICQVLGIALEHEKPFPIPRYIVARMLCCRIQVLVSKEGFG